MSNKFLKYNPIDGEHWEEITSDDAADKYYVHNQTEPAQVWNVTHNLNKRPSVTVVDSGGSHVLGDVIYIDENNVQLLFSAVFAGEAHLN